MPFVSRQTTPLAPCVKSSIGTSKGARAKFFSSGTFGGNSSAKVNFAPFASHCWRYFCHAYLPRKFSMVNANTTSVTRHATPNNKRRKLRQQQTQRRNQSPTKTTEAITRAATKANRIESILRPQKKNKKETQTMMT